MTTAPKSSRELLLLEVPGYRKYLANVVRPFLERERAQAHEEYERYKRELELA